MGKNSARTAVLLVVTLAAGGCGDDPLPLATGAASIAPQADATGGPNDVAAMQQIVNTFDAAWTAGDYVTYAGQYANVDDWVGPTGLVLSNPTAITNLYRGILTGPFAGTTRQSWIRSLVFLTGTIAVLDIEGRVTGFTTLPPGVVPWQPGIIRALEKNILQKRGGEWAIIRHQQTVVAPGVP